MKVLKRLLFVPALPICIGFAVRAEMLSHPQVTPAPLKFEVASVKPSPPDARGAAGCHGVDVPRVGTPLGRCIMGHSSLRTLITLAYPVRVPSLRPEENIVGGPSWIDGSFFDINAEAEDTETTTLSQLQQMLQTLLKERFQLAFHMETRYFSGYALLPAKDGFKLKEAAGPLTSADYAAEVARTHARLFFANNQTLADYVGLLSNYLKEPVVDKTGIAGKYNIFLNSAETGGDDTAPSIFTAIQEQLGLKLEAEKLSFDIVVIDHVEKPSEGRQNH